MSRLGRKLTLVLLATAKAGYRTAMRLSVLRSVPFLFALGCARMAEIDGNFEKARARLSRRAPPREYLALRDAYDARLASIAYARLVSTDGLTAHPPNETLGVFARLQSSPWYWSPETVSERYAARYLDYLEAAILADASRRDALAQELQASSAERLYKQVLLVT